jgi:hypothetical protein
MFRAIRIAVLLLILVAVALSTWLAQARTTSWDNTLRVAVFPIDADGSPATRAYIASLGRATFQPIDDFFAEEGHRYGVAQSDPVDVFVAPEVASIPPQPPDGASIPEVMLWSLQLRFWAWRHGDFDGPAPHVDVFVLYHDPALVQRVPHSLGLQKGLLGVVHAFASQEQSGPNNLVIAHELLHTLGATDKYDSATNLPVHPDGYAEPDRDPLWPQELAEIMAGRIPLSAQRAEMPEALAQALIGEATAREIRWVRF